MSLKTPKALHLKVQYLLQKANFHPFISESERGICKAEACGYAVKAARMLRHLHDKEPTRSVLYRQAACIALDLNYPNLALKLVNEALEGQPPEDLKFELEEIKNELRKD